MNRTTVAVGVGMILCAVSLFYLQGRFDEGDHAKAQRLIRNMKNAGQAETFEEFLVRRHGGVTGTWSSSITGGCRGVVRVTWTVPGNPPTEYAWDVEIPSQGVHPTPTSPGGERLLVEFGQAAKAVPPLELPPLRDGGNK